MQTENSNKKIVGQIPKLTEPGKQIVRLIYKRFSTLHDGVHVLLVLITKTAMRTKCDT